MRQLFPLVSIVTATFNNLALNKAWLQSIVQQTDYPNYEVIAVDNGSSDGTAEWLAEAARSEPRLTVICNRENRGFAAANNQALRMARGEFLCLLNNDTVVTRGWLSTLIAHLRRTPGLGLVGPVSNSVGNAAQVPAGYKSLAELPGWAESYCRRHDGQQVPLEMLGFFCVAMPRQVYRADRRIGRTVRPGLLRGRRLLPPRPRGGLRSLFRRDAFVHHWKEATFKLLGQNVYLERLLRESTAIRGQVEAAMPALMERLRSFVRSRVSTGHARPRGASISTISRKSLSTPALISATFAAPTVRWARAWN